MLFKEIVDARTDARTHGRRTPDIEGSQKLTEHFVLRWAKNRKKPVYVYNKSMESSICSAKGYQVKTNYNSWLINMLSKTKTFIDNFWQLLWTTYARGSTLRAALKISTMLLKRCYNHDFKTRAGSIRKKSDTIRIAIRTKQYAIRIDDTIQRQTFGDIKNLD